MRKILVCITLAMMMACGEDETEKKQETVVIDPGQVEIVKVDFGAKNNYGYIIPEVIFNTRLPKPNLDHYGWFAIMEISEIGFPEKCTETAFKARSVSSFYFQRFDPGKYYTRTCAANYNGFISIGFTKEFEVLK